MRLFAAVRPSPGFLDALRELQEKLRAAGAAGRWREPDGLHLTLAFIGEWPEDVTEVLPAVREPFPVTLSELGIFPKANVLWAGTAPSEQLDRLAEQVRRNLAERGIPFDGRDFRPHITLARKPVLPEGLSLSAIRVPPASMTVDRVYLYRSDRGPDGMVYTVIGSSAVFPEAGCGQKKAEEDGGTEP